ncbi:sigma-54 interaction domain-containing protein [Bacillus piscicola]|uniref:sigma-54 interaction domain-containing protein n=1 Tax=Bacillus piscicola TaxID=1632684 RepID=UPI001F08D3C0|nr:sigma 54-interacting transcriptional regulator [Bacillus piscicola]
MKQDRENVAVKKWMETPIPLSLSKTTIHDLRLRTERGDLEKVVIVNEREELVGIPSVPLGELFLESNQATQLRTEWVRQVPHAEEEEAITEQEGPFPRPVIARNGQVSGVLTETSMLAAYRALSDSLQHHTNVTDMILNSAYEGIAVVDRAGNVQQMNQAYRHFLGIPSEEKVIGRPVQEVIDNTNLHQTIKSGVPEKGEIQVIQGQKMIVHRIPIWKDGEVTGAIGMLIFEGVSDLYRILGKAANMPSVPPFADERKLQEAPPLYTFEQMIGESGRFMESKSRARKAAKTKATVLLTGESGTGKELFAQAIHEMSGRKGAFVSLNCAAIPEHLLEAELFGYEEGAFTGAKRGGHKGKFEAAHYGTLFLDEISTMPLAMQAKLLRILEEKSVVKVGGHVRIPVNVRIIAATNDNLEELVVAHTFREDLYYRLHVIHVPLPPLRERKEDIPLLVGHFIRKFSEDYQLSVKNIDQHAMEHLRAYHWPGNVRELANVAEQLVILTEGNDIRTLDLPAHIQECVPELTDKQTGSTILKENQHQHEKELIEKTIQQYNGNKTEAAAALGIHRTTLYKKIKDYQLSL